MPYVKTTWVNDIPGVQEGTPIDATNMNKIEQGIYLANNTFDNTAGTDSYTITIDGVTSLTEIIGVPILVKFTIANTTACTLNVNALGAKNIVRGTSTALLTGDITANKIMQVVYDGTSFQLLSQGVDASQASKTETLSNKTLAAPRLAAGGFIADANGAELLIAVTPVVASAVNEIGIRNAAAGGSPGLFTQGADANINFNLATKGTGMFTIDDSTLVHASAKIYGYKNLGGAL